MSVSLLKPPEQLKYSGSNSTISDKSNFSDTSCSSFIRRVSFDTISCPSVKSPGSRRGSLSSHDMSLSSETTASTSSSPQLDKQLPSLPTKGPLSSFLSFSNSTFAHCAISSGTNNTNHNYNHRYNSSQSAHDGKDFSTVSVSARHKNYVSTSLSRTFMVLLGDNYQHNLATVSWLVKSLMENGDEVVCVQYYPGVTNGSTSSSFQFGSPHEAPSAKDAQIVLSDILETVDPTCQICVSVELAIGKVRDVAQQSLQMYKPCIVAISSDNKQQWLNIRKRHESFANYMATMCLLPMIVVTAKNVDNFLNEQQCLQHQQHQYSPEMQDDQELAYHPGTSTANTLPNPKYTQQKRPITGIYPVVPKQTEPSHVSKLYPLNSCPDAVHGPLVSSPYRRHSFISKIPSFKDLRVRRRSVS